MKQNFEERQKMYLPSLSHSCYWCYSLLHFCERDSGGLFHCGVTTNFIFIITIHIPMGGSPDDVSEEPVTQGKQKKGWRMCCCFTYVTAQSPTLQLLYLRHSSFSNPSVASPTSQFIFQPFASPTSQALLILKPFHHSVYGTTHSPTLPSLYLRHSSFSNSSVALPTSQLILQPFFRFSSVTGSSLTSPVTQLKRRKGWRMSCDIGKAT